MPAKKSPEELYAQREKRLKDAFELKEPDRIPVVLTTNFLPARFADGVTNADAYYRHQVWKDATRKMIVELEPDIQAAAAGGSGSALAALGPKLFKWPGDGVGPNLMQQFIEGEPLKADEYDLFLSDPGDFTLRYYLPRTWKAMEPLTKLPSLSSLWGASTLAGQSIPFSSPEVVKAFESLAKAGKEQEKYRKEIGNFDDELAALGFPSLHQGNASAPFDVISDHLRGMAGTMLDMYRHPEQLRQACEMILGRSMASGLAALKSKRGNPRRVGTALHRGSDGFMSLKQFEVFYWPTLVKLIQATTEKGLVHVPFYEGDWAQRLSYLQDLPKGKTIARFALTDLAKAKAALKGHTCIMGGLPHTMLQVSSPSEIEDYVKNLIKVCGKGGGFILCTSTGITNEARPENIKVMIDTVKKYGKY